jgi:hypothetical protein
MKGVLLRVGIDRGAGGCIAPIFEDNSFEFIPIPESLATSEERLYINMVGRNGKKIVDFVPKKIKYSHPHYDPEFETFTYGDPTKIKRNQLSKLSPGDLLIFYAGLKRKGKNDKSQVFVIGYFDVEEVYDFKKIPTSDYDSVFKMMPNNAHSKIYFALTKLNVEFSDKDLVIVRGKSKSSKLLTKALPLGDENNVILRKLAIFGYKGSLQRAVGHWIEEEYIHEVIKWLENERL